MSEACNAQENPNVDLYRYDSANQTWSGPLTGPIYRYPTYLEVSQLTSGWKGIAVACLVSRERFIPPTDTRWWSRSFSTTSVATGPARNLDSRTT